MLVIKAFINQRQIDEIKIQRVEDDVIGKGIHEYSIRKPEGIEDIPLYHVYTDGWESLAEHVLHTINRTRKEGWIETKNWQNER